MINTENEKQKFEVQLLTSGVTDLQYILNLVEKNDYQIYLPEFDDEDSWDRWFDGNFISNYIAPTGTEVGLFFNRKNKVFFVNPVGKFKKHKLKYYPPTVGDDILVTVFKNRLWLSLNQKTSSCFVVKFFHNQLIFDWKATRYKLGKLLKSEIANRLLVSENMKNKLLTSDFYNFKFSIEFLPKEFKMKVVEELLYHQLNNGSLPKHLKPFRSKLSRIDNTIYLTKDLFLYILGIKSTRLELIQKVSERFDRNKKRKYKSKEEFQKILKKNFDDFVIDVFNLNLNDSDKYYELVTTKIIPEL